jgi:hypothetical protein
MQSGSLDVQPKTPNSCSKSIWSRTSSSPCVPTRNEAVASAIPPATTAPHASCSAWASGPVRQRAGVDQHAASAVVVGSTNATGLAMRRVTLCGQRCPLDSLYVVPLASISTDAQ